MPLRVGQPNRHAPSTPPWLLSLEALTARLAYLFASELATPVAWATRASNARRSVMAKKKKAKKKSKGY